MFGIDRLRVSASSIAVLSGALAAAAAFALADTTARSYFDTTPVVSHWWQFLLLTVPPVFAAGVGCAAVVHTLQWLSARTPRPWLLPVMWLGLGAFAAWCAAGPLELSLSGLFLRLPTQARWSWLVSLGIVWVLVAAWLWSIEWAVRRAIGGRPALALALGVLGLMIAAALMFADLTVWVALYASLHLLAESTAWVGLGSGASLLFWLAQRRWAHTKLALTAVVALATVWSLHFLSDPALRAHCAVSLHHVWREPLYAARIALRVQLVEDYLNDPGGWSGAFDSRISRLERRYDISTTALSTLWDLPKSGRVPSTARPPLNVLVFFVDTLRSDLANDAQRMPRLAEFKRESIDFAQAYSAAPDTVSTLPVLTGGCYGAVPCAEDSLRVMRSEGVPTGLFVARSANRFLGKLSPHFTFQTVGEIADYPEGKKVWGYGGEVPTAHQVVDKTLKWIDAQTGQQWFAWAFNFDVHNWMHLDEAYLRRIATEVGLDTATEENYWRYTAAAVGVDRAFGALLEGLRRRGLHDRTAVLFVSDHGEALGYREHAYHSVFLWDSLVHVPLTLRVPGERARVVPEPVGHVDVAPTVLSLLFPGRPAQVSHGASLLDDEAREGALPLLLWSMRKEELLRVGLIERRSPVFKLELPLQSAEPMLFETAGQADETDVSHDHNARMLTMLSKLVTSPVFPRSAEPAPGAGDEPRQRPLLGDVAQ